MIVLQIIAAFGMLLMIGLVSGLVGGELFTRYERRKGVYRDKRNEVPELLRWHALWERDHPDLIVHASYTEYLPSREPESFADGLFKLVRPYGGKRGGVDTSALIARFNEAARDSKPMVLPQGMTYERFDRGGYLPPRLPKVPDGPAVGARVGPEFGRYDRKKRSPFLEPCRHENTVEITKFYSPYPQLLCGDCGIRMKSPDEPPPDY